MGKIGYGRVFWAHRKALGISPNEYLVLDQIANYQALKAGWCEFPNSYFADLLGITPRGTIKLMDRLEASGLLERGPGKKRRASDQFLSGRLEMEVNKVHSGGEQSSLQGVNKVHSKGELSSPNKEVVTNSSKEIVSNPRFLVFWNDYGKKVDRAKCERKFNRLSKKDQEDCIASVDSYRAYLETTGGLGQYQKAPLTYLNGRCWETDWKQLTRQALTKPTKKPNLYSPPMDNGGFNII